MKDYFLRAPKINAPAMSYGWQETMEYVESVEDQYSKIVVSRSFSEPQAFVAFYKRWEPEDIQRQTEDWLRYEKEGLKFVDQLGKYRLGKYEFRNLDFATDKGLAGALLVGKPEEFPIEIKAVKKVYYPDGKPAFVLVDPERVL